MYSSDLIIKRIKDDLRNPANKIEGSLGSDNAQAVGAEIARLYKYIDWVNDMHYVDSAEGEWLDKKALDYGLTRKLESYASGQITFYGDDGKIIPRGTLVSSDTLEYEILQEGIIKEGICILPARCTSPGLEGNLPEGAVLKNNRLSGINRIVAGAITGGTDKEPDEDFRNRLLLYIRYPGTSGNAYHYMHWALSVDGVGRVKVYPLWDGPGTVKVSILDASNKKANSELIKKVKNHIDPDDGMGTELAPIGAYLTVSTAEEIEVSINYSLSIKKGFEKETISATFQEKLEEYFRGISYTGNPTKLSIETDITVVSYAKIIDILMDIDGVIDVTELTINGEKESLNLEGEKIPITGEVMISD